MKSGTVLKGGIRPAGGEAIGPTTPLKNWNSLINLECSKHYRGAQGKSLGRRELSFLGLRRMEKETAGEG